MVTRCFNHIYLENLINLVNFRFSREERFLGEKFAKYAAHRPHVHSCGVLLRREEQTLWQSAET